MSMQNLLDVEGIGERPNSPEKPKPRPRKILSQNEPPRPKPRKIVETGIGDVVSISSVSSGGGDQLNQPAAFDNPVFQIDTEDLKSLYNRSPPTKDGFQSSESESGGSRRSSNRKKANITKHAKMILQKSKDRNYIDDADDLSSGWDEEETYLCIENETTSEIPKSKEVHSGFEMFEASSPKSIRSFKPTPEKNKRKKKHDEHVAIDVEKASKQSPIKSEENTKTQKSAAGSIWKRFLSKGLKAPTQQQEELPLEKSKEKSQKMDKKDKSIEIKEQDKTPSIETRIEIPSEGSSTDEDEVMTISKSREEIVEIVVDKVNKSEQQHEKLVTEKIQDKLKYFKSRSKKILKTQQETENKELIQIPLVREVSQDFPSPKKVSRPPRPFQRKRQETLSTRDEFGQQNSLFGITIHSSDLLPIDPNILHPVVKVTLMTQDGKRIRRSNGFTSSQETIGRSKGRRKGDKRRQRTDEESERNPAELESILPMMTQPFKMSRKNPTFSPTWDELLLFEEPFHNLLSDNPNLIIFFELMDFLPMERASEIPTSGYHGLETGWYKVAWAFLKPVGANGIFNTDRKLRLQLYKPRKLRNKEKLPGPEIFSWWKCEKKEKLLNTTLYVTVKGINPPCSKVSIRQLLSMRKEDLTDAVIENQLGPSKQRHSTKKNNRELTEANEQIRKQQVNWARLEGQSCKVPNKFLTALPSSKIESLNITVSGNVHCLQFSPCGLKLAAGLDTEQLHAVLIFEIPSGILLRSFKNHQGLIYDLAWKQMEVDNNSSVHYLASASADSTAIVWKMKNNNENTLRIIKVLDHPAFVYCVDFHPTHPSLVATGCFDCIIRVWNVVTVSAENQSRRTLNKEMVVHDSCPLFILDRHSSFVNTLLFNNDGTYLFSGDGDSCVYKWSIKSPSKKKTWKIDRDVKLTETGKIPVNSLALHPNESRLLVHLRDNCLKVLDVATFIQIQTVRGLVNDRLQIRSTFSPCGNLIISGSENSTICIWDSDTSAILQFISPSNHPNCFVTSVDYHPFDFYMVVGLASSISEPNPILLYNYETPKLAGVALVSAGVAKFKSNLRKINMNQPLNSVNNLHSSRKNVTFAAKRGDSSEKFLNIINKLDKALKEAQDPKRIRPKSESLQRSLSEDVQRDKQNKIIQPNQIPNSGSTTDKNSKSNKDSHKEPDTQISRKHKSKSPRTYIEDRLEELIIPLSIDSVNQSKEMNNEEINNVPTNSTTSEDPNIVSPKNLPKSKRQRPQSSKIPVRCKTNSPMKNSGDSSVSTTPSGSPVIQRSVENKQVVVTADVQEILQ